MVCRISWNSVKMLALACLLACAQPAMASERYVAAPESGFNHQFWLYYMAVQHSLKGNSGQLRAAAKLDHINPVATRFLAKFWWKKIQRDCKDFGLNDPVLITNKIDKVDIMQNVNEDLKYCAYDVIYRNWADVNATILNRLRTEQVDKRHAILASLQAMGLTSKSYR